MFVVHANLPKLFANPCASFFHKVLYAGTIQKAKAHNHVYVFYG